MDVNLMGDGMWWGGQPKYIIWLQNYTSASIASQNETNIYYQSIYLQPHNFTKKDSITFTKKGKLN